ncbi:hypothetical protein MVLG_01377 [Microbotryum lychnidis-dioicae p1A1 Lamole]|uniref:Uncharacterized protein n=1 Tax=Microbotryum lychnidis-dioicae (strain p1A1 Lamole / MvSl-1064) TaxID=683840 RepID=U5H1Y1_USTV1|nr:hypothetical protein MVLG_01377 [Microbotryum lychnidis-dioicae p1A1 Lamole]|eukprot:KDE08336.1 hypothetical protein MVLG_01377 [Microbotryum lychnidis-dioicae p1A1 Lamole]
MTKAVGRWDNVSPRVNVDKASARLSEQMLARFKRDAPMSLTTRLTQFATLTPFIQLSSNLTGVRVESIKIVSFLYFITRFLYNPNYIYGTSAKVALLR